MNQNLQVPTESTQQDSKIKFCKDCKHHIMSTSGPSFWKCARTRVVSFIDGTVTYNYCDTERGLEKYCGEEAHNFEAING